MWLVLLPLLGVAASPHVSPAVAGPCELDLLAYHSLASPMALGGTEAAPTLATRGRGGGSVEFALPPCARASGAAAFSLEALVISSSQATGACNLTLNAKPVSVPLLNGGGGGGGGTAGNNNGGTDHNKPDNHNTHHHHHHHHRHHHHHHQQQQQPQQ